MGGREFNDHHHQQQQQQHQHQRDVSFAKFCCRGEVSFEK
jgi:hypothetical protein